MSLEATSPPPTLEDVTADQRTFFWARCPECADVHEADAEEKAVKRARLCYFAHSWTDDRPAGEGA